MNTEIAKWIDENNPYSTYIHDTTLDNVIRLRYTNRGIGWNVGAVEMAEHLTEGAYHRKETIKLIEDVIDYVKRFGVEESNSEQIYDSLFSDVNER